MDWNKILKYIMRILPVRVIVDAFIDWLKDIVSDTENQLDDQCVEILQMVLYNAFGWER